MDVLRGEGKVESFSESLFSACSRWIFSLGRRAGEYRVKYFLFLPKMFSHFWLRNKKVLGRKATTFQPKKITPTGKKKDSPHSFTKARQVSLFSLRALSPPKKQKG